MYLRLEVHHDTLRDTDNNCPKRFLVWVADHDLRGSCPPVFLFFFAYLLTQTRETLRNTSYTTPFLVFHPRNKFPSSYQDDFYAKVSNE
jgi:hypothetical protein